MTQPLLVVGSFGLPASRERVWPLIADTDSFAQALGLAPLRIVSEPDPRGGVSLQAIAGRTRYEEGPYRWIVGREHEVRRSFQGGPIAACECKTQLEDEPGGCRVTVTIRMFARSELLKPWIQMNAPRTRRRLARVYAGLAAFLRGERSAPYPTPRPHLARGGRERLEAGTPRLIERGFAPETLELLKEWLLEAPDRELAALRPFALAERWGASRSEVLRLCLVATRAGWLELGWDLMCSACRGPVRRLAHLGEVPAEIHCEACNLRQDATFDRSIEATFRVHPGVRAVREERYCLGGPWRTPHVVAQEVVQPEDPWALELELEPGTYRLRSPQVSEPMFLTVMPGETDRRREIRVQAHESGFAPEGVDLFGSHLRLLLETDSPVVVDLERFDDPPPGATAAYLSTTPEFRDRFGDEVLAPGLSLEISRLALLFTDFKGVTALYEQAGETRAFSLVQAHFRILEAAIALAGGVRVKTLGDGMMAAFADPVACVQAMVEAQRAIARYNAATPHPAGPIVVKLGAHLGPCLAVTLDERLDYVGTTVNVAARIRNEAEGHDLVLSEDLLEAPGVRSWLATVRMRHQETFPLHMKGLTTRVPLTRYLPDERYVI